MNLNILSFWLVFLPLFVAYADKYSYLLIYRDVNKAGSFKAKAKSLKAKARSLKAKARDQG